MTTTPRRAKHSVRTDYKGHAAAKERENQALRVALGWVLTHLGHHYGGGLLTAPPPESERDTHVAMAYRVAEEAARMPVANV